MIFLITLCLFFLHRKIKSYLQKHPTNVAFKHGIRDNFSSSVLAQTPSLLLSGSPLDNGVPGVMSFSQLLLTSQGNTNPELELQATLQQFLNRWVKIGQHVRCPSSPQNRISRMVHIQGVVGLGTYNT